MSRWVKVNGFRKSFSAKRVGIGLFKGVNFICGVHLFATYVARPAMVDGPSMMPTLSHSGDLLIESCLSRRLWPTSFQRGDLVTVISPLDPHRLVCKRILGLEGDTVCVDPTGDVVPSNEHIVVPKGHIWIIGDNATASRDSRTYGPVPMALVQGKVLARVLPISKFTIFRNPVTVIQ